MSLEEPAQLATMLLLLRLEVGEQVDEPLEALLVSVDPDEVHLPQVEHAPFDLVTPTLATTWACVLDVEEPVGKQLLNLKRI